VHLAHVGADEGQRHEAAGRRARHLHEQGRVVLLVHQRRRAAIDRRAVKPRGSAVHVAPDPEQVARGGRKHQPAVAEGVARHHGADGAAGHVEQADAVAVVAHHVLGPGEPAVVRAVLVAGGAVVGVAAGAFGLVEQHVFAAVRPGAREHAVRVPRHARDTVAPAGARGGLGLVHLGRARSHAFEHPCRVGAQGRQHGLGVGHLGLQVGTQRRRQAVERARAGRDVLHPRIRIAPRAAKLGDVMRHARRDGRMRPGPGGGARKRQVSRHGRQRHEARAWKTACPPTPGRGRRAGG
jgi:hypothetical protein